MWIDTWGNIQRESPWVAPSWQFELVLWDISFGFPLANHYNLPGSQSIFGPSQDPPMCVHAFLSQGGFYQKGVWVRNIPWHDSPLTSKKPFLHKCGWGGLLTLRNEICGLGRAQPPPLVVLLFLEFQSIGNESPIALLWEEGAGRAHLPSASTPYLTPCSFILFI